MWNIEELEGRKKTTVDDLTLGQSAFKVYHNEDGELLRVDNLIVVGLAYLKPYETSSEAEVTLLLKDGGTACYRVPEDSTKIGGDIYLDMNEYVDEQNDNVSGQ